MYLIMKSSAQNYDEKIKSSNFKQLNNFYEEKSKFIEGRTRVDDQFFRYNLIYGSIIFLPHFYYKHILANRIR